MQNWIIVFSHNCFSYTFEGRNIFKPQQCKRSNKHFIFSKFQLFFLFQYIFARIFHKFEGGLTKLQHIFCWQVILISWYFSNLKHCMRYILQVYNCYLSIRTSLLSYSLGMIRMQQCYVKNAISVNSKIMLSSSIISINSSSCSLQFIIFYYNNNQVKYNYILWSRNKWKRSLHITLQRLQTLH
jgi:hypothetical protein